MKIVYAFVVFLLMSFTHLQAQEITNPGQYMDAISKQQENISKRYMSYVSASAHGKRERKVENLRNKLLAEIEEAKSNIQALPGYNGDKSYRDTAVNFMKFYYNVMNDDYNKIINMEEIAEQSYDEMEAYLLLQEKIQEKLSEANNKLSLAAKTFAANNKVNLVESTSALNEMMKEVGGVSKHYHEVYLVFFKPYIQEKNMLAAIAKGNMTGMEQSRSAMLKYAQEGLVKLSTMTGFNGDKSIVYSCKSMLNFYVKEAEKSSTISDFFLTKEKFENIKKEMEKKSSKSKEDIDAYNKGVNDINKAAEVYNNNNNELNNMRNEKLNEWNKSVKTFFDEHTPRYK
ncbi:hypothetical protein ACFOWM_03660 [Ferruginibacter yonginensis]|uniref:DUF3829 domain-containing protein n=1 Tax=Ferruginibacter yonginensis TaxID=1310416 RepID=A0ABV8QP39_9BACT